MKLPDFERIMINLRVMGGRPCVRGIRITVGTITELIASGETVERVLELDPSIQREDSYAALAYANWRTEEFDMPLKASLRIYVCLKEHF